MTVAEEHEQRRAGRSMAPARRTRPQRTFTIDSAGAADDELMTLEERLITGGWLPSAHEPDLVLVDARRGRMPPGVQHRRSHLLLIVHSEREAVELLEAGAGDGALIPGDPDAVTARLLTAARSIEKARRATSLIGRAKRRSETDPLTRLGNRRALEPALRSVLHRVEAGIPAGLLIVDVDRFKVTNDRFGHLYGDRFLAEIGQAIAGVLRDDRDSAHRWGGDEFVVVIGDATEAEVAAVAERLRSSVAALAVGTSDSRADDHVTISVGLIALTPGATITPLDALAAADAALYEAKRTGRDRVCVGTLAGTEDAA
ncbi:MAG: diguanylate cyclase [Chloroflexota bacterium]